MSAKKTHQDWVLGWWIAGSVAVGFLFACFTFWMLSR
jgi:hypothetical protein